MTTLHTRSRTAARPEYRRATRRAVLKRPLHHRGNSESVVLLLERPVVRSGGANDIADAPTGAACQHSRREYHAGKNSNFSQADTRGEVLDHSHPTEGLPMTRFSNSLSDALLANGPAQDRREKMGLYGRPIGDWTMEATVHLSDGNTHLGCGQIQFG